MSVVVAIDPGLATLGLVAVETNGLEHRLVLARFFETAPRTGNQFMRDGRVLRARELRAWLRVELGRLKPAAVVLEEFGFLQGQHATACLAMAYDCIVGVVDDVCPGPLIACTAKRARDELAGIAEKSARPSTKGMSKQEAQAVNREAQHANRKRTEERELRAQNEAARRVAGARNALDEMGKVDRKHVADALVLFCWGVLQPPVRDRLIAARAWGPL